MKADNTAIINIEGYIGIPEAWQHNPDMAKKIVSTKEKMRKEIDTILNLKSKKINVNIDSFGGDVNHGLSIYNALALSPAQVNIMYTGWCASIATVIGAAGNTVSAPSNFMGLLHESRGGTHGTRKDFEDAADGLNKINNIAADIYALKGGQSSETYLQLMGENNGEGKWRTAEELKAVGLIDEIIEPMKAAACFEGFEMKAKEYNLNTNIEMGIFSKEVKTVNNLKLGEITAVYEGDLKAGTKVLGLGSAVEDGTFNHEGKELTIENSIVKSIQEKGQEMVALEVLNTANAEIETLRADLAARDAELLDITEKYNNLTSLSSTHKPPQANANTEPPVIDIEKKVRMNVNKILEEKREAFEKSRGV